MQKDNFNYKISENAFFRECSIDRFKCVTLYDEEGLEYTFRADKTSYKTISIKVGEIVAVISTENGQLLDIKGSV